MASEHNNTHEPGTCPMLWRRLGDNVSVSTGFHRKLTPLPPEPPHPWRRGRLRGRSTAGRWPSPPDHSPEEPDEQPRVRAEGPHSRPPCTTPLPPPRTIRYVQHPDEGRAFYVQADLGSGLPSSSGRRTPAPPCGSSRPRRGAPERPPATAPHARSRLSVRAASPLGVQRRERRIERRDGVLF